MNSKITKKLRKLVNKNQNKVMESVMRHLLKHGPWWMPAKVWISIIQWVLNR